MCWLCRSEVGFLCLLYNSCKINPLMWFWAHWQRPFQKIWHDSFKNNNAKIMNFVSILSGPTVHVKIYCTTVKDTIQKQKKLSILRLSDRAVDSRRDGIELHLIYVSIILSDPRMQTSQVQTLPEPQATLLCRTSVDWCCNVTPAWEEINSQTSCLYIHI